MSDEIQVFRLAVAAKFNHVNMKFLDLSLIIDTNQKFQTSSSN